ncbi:zinc finger MYND domain-containing protein [Sporobolomyces koalae]|uniref:zinc finger MYND domain-containing protein n=1 Tax=Sporobolomyces koalae TaxID=500713 RepID=UPI003181EB77
MTTEIECRACLKTPETAPVDSKFLVCARCQTLTGGQRKTYYCSKSCQTLDWSLHKPTICGQPLPPVVAPADPSRVLPAAGRELESIDTSLLSPHLLFQIATLKTLASQLPPPPPASTSVSRTSHRDELHPIPSYLFFPTSPLSSSSTSSSSSNTSESTLPIPIHLSTPSHKLFQALFLASLPQPPSSSSSSIRSSSEPNLLSITLMYSLLVTRVEALRGQDGESRLVQQLEQEYFPNSNGNVIRTEIDKDVEPSEEQLKDAIGGEHNVELLLEWQMEEAERIRAQTTI